MSITVFPRFSEVDVLGHVTNTALPVWFEEGRRRSSGTSAARPACAT
ncbi:hypothetical protein NMB32_24195 [Stenotrophomonas sp. CD2]|nr:hypothetical protein NMB32_24195 [Stenotrophomonas sp. CD2]